MQTYIALLRGINVSGQKLIKMADLRQHLSALSFQNIQTYIQSGNIVFQSHEKADAVESLIAEKIEEVYGFTVPVLVKSKEELNEIYEHNPFLNGKDSDSRFLHVTMLNGKSKSDAKTLLYDYIAQSEKLAIRNREVYLFMPSGYGKTKLTNTLIEKKLGVNATTRNWKTITKLVEMVIS